MLKNSALGIPLKPAQQARIAEYNRAREIEYARAGLAPGGADGSSSVGTTAGTGGVVVDPDTGDAYRMENGRPVKVGNVNQ